MTILEDRIRTVCDGDGCGAESERPDGWLFVARGPEHRHYCPACLVAYLDDLREPPRPKTHTNDSP